jgi:hypothetical protein
MEAPIGEYTDKNESKNISSDQRLNYFESKGVCSSTLPNNKIPHPSQAGGYPPPRSAAGNPLLPNVARYNRGGKSLGPGSAVFEWAAGDRYRVLNSENILESLFIGTS